MPNGRWFGCRAMTRSFVAIDLPETAADTLARIAAACPSGRPVTEENMHLTLAFIGEVDDAALEEAHDALSAIRAGAFEIRIGGLSTFGGDVPRTLWAAVLPDPRLSALEKDIRRALRRAGLELPHRRFVPHVTLVRFGREPLSAEFPRFIERNAALRLGPLPVRHFGLYASHLGKAGPAYDLLEAYPLG